MMKAASRSVILMSLGLAAALGSAACGQSQGSSAPAVEQGVVNATLDEFTIQLDRSTISSGKVTFKVKNGGKMVHELIVLKTDLPADKIPPDPKDSSKVDETASVGEVPDIGAGESKSGAIDVQPGKYVLICNKPGHYSAGQYIAFTVT
jgi:uncharacterized cupredoxin-like copper-binding protein